jgi:endogenous inhibitor of DNA gyrase (YacG/DUF329 family)
MVVAATDFLQPKKSSNRCLLTVASPIHEPKSSSQSRRKTVLSQEMISLECPHCHKELYQPLTWFKEEKFVCPVCGKGLTAGEFSKIVQSLEEALEASHAEMIHGDKPSAGCCGGKGNCSGK